MSKLKGFRTIDKKLEDNPNYEKVYDEKTKDYRYNYKGATKMTNKEKCIEIIDVKSGMEEKMYSMDDQLRQFIKTKAKEYIPSINLQDFYIDGEAYIFHDAADKMNKQEFEKMENNIKLINAKIPEWNEEFENLEYKEQQKC